MTQIRVHELASELNVSTEQVLSLLEDFGKKVRGPSTVVGASDAAKVRGRFRAGRPRPAVNPGTERSGDHPTSAAAPLLSQSLFLPPAAPPRQPATAPYAAAFADPFAVPAAAAQASGRSVRNTEPAKLVGPAKTTPSTAAGMAGGPHIPAQASPRDAVSLRPRAAAEPVAPTMSEAQEVQVDEDALWARHGMDQAEREMWCAAGLRAAEPELAARCRSVGITPSELSLKLSGRTGLQRLRDGEASTSVWARIREAEQQPGRVGTKLTGRFQLS